MSNTELDLDGQETTNWEDLFSQNAKEAQSSAIRELLDLVARPEIISLAGGLPGRETLPLSETNKALSHYAEENKKKILQYCSTDGLLKLREYLAEKMKEYGINAEPGNILPTSGSQQALDLIGKTFLDRADTLISSAPTYTGAIQAFKFFGANFLTVNLDKERGMEVEAIPDLLEQYNAKFIYVLPNFHNPAGVTLAKERRFKLAQIAADNGIFIVEDDPYGELRYKGDNITPILPLHKENVLYLSTFSKTLAPGLRLGWITAPKKVIQKLIQVKQGTDLCTPALTQSIASYICNKEGLMEKRIKKISEIYQGKRETILSALEERMPKEISWTTPKGGLFLWASLPKDKDSKELFDLAQEEYNVAFVYGSAFYPNKDVSNEFRLNFSYPSKDEIREGIQRLAEATKAYLNKN